MPDPLEWIDELAAERRRLGLDRRLRTLDPGLVDFSSNDYLGLAADPRVIAEATRSAEAHGFGAGASPLVSGWKTPHEALAEAIAEFEGVEAACLFPTGYAANLGVVAALASRGDAVYLGRLNHASLIDGARLSGASLRVYPHDDAAKLGAILGRDRGRYRRSIVATDGVFGMDGDLAPLEEIADVCEHHDAILVVDEAHGTGVFGPEGRGACAHLGVSHRVSLRVGTLSKALGSLGGFAAGSRRLIDHLVNHARTMIYSTAAPPACASAAMEALRISRSEPWRRESIHVMASALRAGLADAGCAVAPSVGPIVPVIVGDPRRAMGLASRLRDRGFLVGAIRPPTVPEGSSRLRISVSAARTHDQIRGLIEAIGTPS